MSRCLYNSSFEKFINADENSIFSALCDNYHGDALTTTREAWKAEISIMKDILAKYADKNGQVIFEYDIPRLGKRIDVVGVLLIPCNYMWFLLWPNMITKISAAVAFFLSIMFSTTGFLRLLYKEIQVI